MLEARVRIPTPSFPPQPELSSRCRCAHAGRRKCFHVPIKPVSFFPIFSCQNMFLSTLYASPQLIFYFIIIILSHHCLPQLRLKTTAAAIPSSRGPTRFLTSRAPSSFLFLSQSLIRANLHHMLPPPMIHPHRLGSLSSGRLGPSLPSPSTPVSSPHPVAAHDVLIFEL